MMVGRSENVYGPYVDRDGSADESWWWFTVLEGDTNWYGVGHNAVVNFNERITLFFMDMMHMIMVNLNYGLK